MGPITRRSKTEVHPLKRGRTPGAVVDFRSVSRIDSEEQRLSLHDWVNMRARPSVILIREWEAQISGSGCCGRLEGDFLTRDREPAFRKRRACMEAMAPLSRTLRERFGDAIELQVVDPRNTFLVFLLLRDFWAFRVGFVEALKTIGRLPIQAVVVNGRLVARGEWPDPLEVVQILEEAMSQPDMFQLSPNA